MLGFLESSAFALTRSGFTSNACSQNSGRNNDNGIVNRNLNWNVKSKRNCSVKGVNSVKMNLELLDSHSALFILSAQSASASAESMLDNTQSLGITGLVFFLTFWGLISFVKGSTKARIEQRNYSVQGDPADLARRTAAHFLGRSFAINREADKRPGVVTFEGMVAPSTALAALLVFCLAIGLSGLVIILDLVLPEQYQSPLWWNIVWLSGLVAPWYWNGAKRVEQVKLMIEENSETEKGMNTIFIKGHRDELLEFEQALGYKRNEPAEE
uniref:Uncharacterized protein n=1 Tax=Timspurckia oligopyrenoides TaxID=708627 RepID=A0A7S1ERL7_9RHOD|mmetsp:Transcript_221/g.388  ORF Transcript_221/g.388 Transcript_221/m.388 type:complete len:270 (+) Transcript_221:133-942(+)